MYNTGNFGEMRLYLTDKSMWTLQYVQLLRFNIPASLDFLIKRLSKDTAALLCSLMINCMIKMRNQYFVALLVSFTYNLKKCSIVGTYVLLFKYQWKNTLFSPSKYYAVLLLDIPPCPVSHSPNQSG